MDWLFILSQLSAFVLAYFCAMLFSYVTIYKVVTDTMNMQRDSFHKRLVKLSCIFGFACAIIAEILAYVTIKTLENRTWSFEQKVWSLELKAKIMVMCITPFAGFFFGFILCRLVLVIYLLRGQYGVFSGEWITGCILRAIFFVWDFEEIELLSINLIIYNDEGQPEGVDP